jgi:lactoylglutathione lyase
MLNLVVIRAQDIDRLGSFYAALGFRFIKHRHGEGPEHLSCAIGETVFEIYPRNGKNESTVSTRLGFSVPSLADALGVLRNLDATVLAEPTDSPFGLRAIVKDFEGHKVELTEMRREQKPGAGSKLSQGKAKIR